MRFPWVLLMCIYPPNCSGRHWSFERTTCKLDTQLGYTSEKGFAGGFQLINVYIVEPVNTDY